MPLLATCGPSPSPAPLLGPPTPFPPRNSPGIWLLSTLAVDDSPTLNTCLATTTLSLHSPISPKSPACPKAVTELPVTKPSSHVCGLCLCRLLTRDHWPPRLHPSVLHSQPLLACNFLSPFLSFSTAPFLTLGFSLSCPGCKHILCAHTQ